MLRAKWTATAGFSDSAFISFDDGAYASMRDDEKRTPFFERAIRERLKVLGPDAVVVDLGTGPFAVLALIAARSGAKKVYAIEAVPQAAKRAREAIRAATDIAPGVIEVVEGFSTSVTLPEKCDLCVAEIVGSVASEEGLHATMRDAQARLLKRPNDEASYIPVRCQTVAAPAAYALHYALGPPQYDWGKIASEPVRLNCRDETLQLLAEPQLIEDVGFADPKLARPGPWAPSPTGAPLRFAVSAERIASAEKVYRDELTREGAKGDEVERLAVGASRSLSGLAMWPRLVLDPAGSIVCESRGPRGEPQKSHWQTVLPLLSARPVPVAADQVVTVDAAVQLGGRVDEPPVYDLTAQIS